MNNTIYKIAEPSNEEVKNYKPQSHDSKKLIEAIEKLSENIMDIPLIIGGKEIYTENKGNSVAPHNHSKILAHYSKAGPREVKMAITAALKAKESWDSISWLERATIAMRAAELIATKYRYVLNAATMLNQSKSVYQAEIDSAAETIDYLRFNSYFASQIYSEQPKSFENQLNRMEYRPLEGFVYTVTPFNFTAIASNLNMSPVLMGNTTVWKPSSSAVLSGYILMKIFKEAGLPDGVINFIPGNGAEISREVLAHSDMAGIHFTGSTATFNSLWKQMSQNIGNYKSYPRIVGETGGKDFIFVHSSADVSQVATAIIRGAFEYQGQKCSAASRAYIPKSLWSEIKEKLLSDIKDIKVGDVSDFSNFMNAVIDESSYDKIMGYIDAAKYSDDAVIMAGGNGDKSTGYFIEPTIIVASDPDFITMKEEIFGPVMTIYVYEDSAFEETLKICDRTSPYALTGAIFATDRYAIVKASESLRYSAGNFYINDKPTGAVVGLQPFGGSRASGTNDKAGGFFNLMRWISPRTVKETFIPADDYKYPFMTKSSCKEVKQENH